jgi:hypothetical protein
MDPQRQRLEPEWAVVVLSSLVHSGDVVLSIPGKKFDATGLTALAATAVDELVLFKHIERPKDWNIPALKALFELLNLASGQVQLLTQGNETPVTELQKEVLKTVERIVTAQQYLEPGLPVWQRALLDEAETERSRTSLNRTKEFFESLQAFNTPGKLKNFRYDKQAVESRRAGLQELADLESLHGQASSIKDVTSYLSVAEINLPADHALVTKIKETREDILKKLLDPAERKKPAFRQQTAKALDEVKKSYVKEHLDLLTQGFILTLKEVLSGLIKVPLKMEDLKKALFTDGSPVTVADMKKRFDEYLDDLTKGKEPGKVRILLE